ncbi:MAG: hypothetical protein QW548_02070 [Candidatus Aenigmatarchaeota archaeon]
MAEDALRSSSGLDVSDEAQRAIERCASTSLEREHFAMADALKEQPSPMAGMFRSEEQTQTAAKFLTCALLNFADIQTARKAYSVYTVPSMKEKVVSALESYDKDVAVYITGR